MKIWQLRSLILKRVFFAFTAPSPPVHTGCHCDSLAALTRTVFD